MSENMLEVKNLKKYYKVNSGMLHAVDDVSFSIKKGQTLGVVGESGCGKTTLGRTILRLVEPTAGEIHFDGKDIIKLKQSEMRVMRQKMQIIFQDPYSSLNPRMSVGQLIAEPLSINKLVSSKQEAEKKVRQYMEVTGLAQRLINAYPHELDGGRRQRVGIARALIMEPSLIVCDEPVSALDVSIQAQILNLLQDIQEEMGLTYIFITHDLSVVKHISDDIIVMYLGQIAEMAATKELFNNPLHPYTQALLRAIPVPEYEERNRHIETLRGEVVSPIDPKPGCRFVNRCAEGKEECHLCEYEIKEVSSGHFVSCHKY